MDSNFVLAACSLLFAAISAGAAWQAVRASKAIQKASEAGELRSLMQKVTLAAKDCTLSLEEINRLERTMHSDLKMSQVARGVREDSATKIMQSWAVSQLQKANEVCGGVARYSGAQQGAAPLDSEEAHAALIYLESTLKDLGAIRAQFVEQMEKINAGTAQAMTARRGRP